MNQLIPTTTKPSMLPRMPKAVFGIAAIATLAVFPVVSHAVYLTLTNYEFPDTGNWYSLHAGKGPAAVNTPAVCRIDIPGCSVASGNYMLKNWTTGSVTPVLVKYDNTSCSPQEYQFPNNGHWHSLQRVRSGAVVCRQDMLPCMPPNGKYILKDWSTGESWFEVIRDKSCFGGGKQEIVDPINDGQPPT